jgi:conflict system STAND superfamily ATPase
LPQELRSVGEPQVTFERQQALVKEPERAEHRDDAPAIRATDAAEDRCVRGDEYGAGPGPGQKFSEGQCPYRGLRAFDVNDAAFFFGREALIQELLSALRLATGAQSVNRFLAIIGASGSGKSSLARAGLVLAIKRDGIPASSSWPVVILRPGLNPLESLAAAVSGVPSIEQSNLIAEFQKNEKTLHLISKRSLPENAPMMRFVVLVDQFEEVFTLCSKDKLRDAFIRNLLYASSPHIS